MFADLLRQQVGKVVMSNRWRRHEDAFHPSLLTTSRVSALDWQTVLMDSSIGAWIRDNGDVWLLDPAKDQFVVAVTAPLRGRPTLAVEQSLEALVEAAKQSVDVKLDAKASVSIVVRERIVEVLESVPMQEEVDVEASLEP